MPTPALKDAMQHFLAGTHVAVLSVQNDSNRPPLAHPVFYHYEPAGTITVFTNTYGQTRHKTHLIDANRAVTMTVQDEQPPFRNVSVECTLTDVNTQPGRPALLTIVGRYLPEEDAEEFVTAHLSDPTSSLILYSFTPQRWHQFGFDQPTRS